MASIKAIKGAPCWSFASELRVSGNETQYVVMLVATQQQRLNHWFRFRQKFHGCGSSMFLQELQIAPLRVPKSHWPGGTTVKRIHQKQLFPREGHRERKHRNGQSPNIGLWMLLSVRVLLRFCDRLRKQDADTIYCMWLLTKSLVS